MVSMSACTLSYRLVSQCPDKMLQKCKIFRIRPLASCFLAVEKSKNEIYIVKY